MKKIFLLFSLITLSLTSMADEGMWMIALIGKNYAAMQKAGLKLSADDIYNVNNASLKDAVVSFGGYCTGELVSNDGLLFTNHHCGFESIQQLSSLQDNIIKDGFFAKSRTEERPVPGLHVDFFIRMEDLTNVIADATAGKTGAEREAVVKEKSKEAIKNAEEGGKYRVEVKSSFRGAETYLFVYQVFNDVRMVAAPPSAIGNYGGDTDNWMWPRHTGDYSVFRVYAAADNTPAEFSTSNVPYHPKKHLTINANGLKEGDYTMTIGFPGSTNRYLSSYTINNLLGQQYPCIVNANAVQLEEMKKVMDKDPQAKIDMAATYAQVANGYKLFTGQTDKQTVARVITKKEEEEKGFRSWCNQNNKTEYLAALNNLKNVYESYNWGPTANYTQQLMTNEPTAAASQFVGLGELLAAKKSDKKAIAEAGAEIKASLKQVYGTSRKDMDINIMERLINLYIDNVPADQQAENIKNKKNFINPKTGKIGVRAFVEYAYNNSLFADSNSVKSFLTKPSAKALNADPVYAFSKTVSEAMQNFTPMQMANAAVFKKENNTYIKGLREMNKDKFFYADANFTMRVSYGNVAPLQPRDAVNFNSFTTLDGVMEKENPNSTEFEVPKKLKQLWQNKDYGRFANADGKMPLCYITTNDITGGNSGSPVLNANGELIGLAFDGNWEGAVGDYYYDINRNRTICVDIRYVLFTLTKFGGCDYLLSEMQLK